ncbi:hypothetical protein SEA_DIZZYRUDY_45 [Microbacterium phage DizzyRudy]|nr:hypothetical protein SEA_DIZZYRUDY_45 [Microbacterium phage DizzyRudy]WMI34480.1 hypothetical protein SEA_DAMASCUS_43 [Microbacterium phage Damascus]
MLTALIPTVASIVVSTSAGVAIDSAVKMIVPIGIKALPAFGIKVGTAVASAFIGAKVGSIVEKNISEVIATLNNGAEEVTSDQEDN